MVSRNIGVIGLLVILLLLAIMVPNVSAHGDVEVEGYEVVIGFRDEPAYVGLPNGLDLVVTNEDTGERVTGLEETLQVEIIFGSDVQELDLRAVFGEEGAYTADVLPTEPGDYTWRIWGQI
jgi:hypothetical protein